MPASATRVLAFHAGYRCRNRGACCTAGWPIPVEADRLLALRAEMAAGRVRPVHGTSSSAVESPPNAPSESPALLATAHGHCVFHDPAGACAIHAALGHVALPLACRQFPRVSVIDPRGVSVTLSHYCPTAGELLEPNVTGDSDAKDAALLLNPAGFPASAEYVGLDARGALPPLLRPGMLMDWESWWEIERLGVVTLLNAGADAEAALARLKGAVGALQSWSPREGALLNRAREAFRTAVAAPPFDGTERITRSLAGVPEAYRASAQWHTRMVTSDRVARRFLAAHAFANWTIHLGGDLSGWVRSIETAHAFLRAGAGVRQTDLVLRHLMQ